MKTFKKIAVLSFLGVGTAIASAAPATNSLHVNVPFSFVVAGKVFPNGQYTVQETDLGVILVRGEGQAAVVLSIPGKTLNANAVPALHFLATNGQEYLVSVDNNLSSRIIPLHVSETRTLTLSH